MTFDNNVMPLMGASVMNIRSDLESEESMSVFDQIFEAIKDWFSSVDIDYVKELLWKILFNEDSIPVQGEIYAEIERLAGEDQKGNFQQRENHDRIEYGIDLPSGSGDSFFKIYEVPVQESKVPGAVDGESEQIEAAPVGRTFFGSLYDVAKSKYTLGGIALTGSLVYVYNRPQEAFNLVVNKSNLISAACYASKCVIKMGTHYYGMNRVDEIIDLPSVGYTMNSLAKSQVDNYLS